MQPTRSRGMFGPGGPLNTSTAAMKLAIAVVAGSVLVQLIGDAAKYVLLWPAMVVGNFALWQPLTYVPVATSIFGVIFGALIMWSIGGALEARWGSRRLLTYAIGSTAIAGLLTVVVGLVWSSVYDFPYAGATVMTTAVWVAYGWSLGRQQTGFWGLPLTGNGLAWIGVGFVALNAVFSRSLVPVIPDVFAVIGAWFYVSAGSPRVLVLKLRQWKLQRELKSRSKHLRVISKERNTHSGSDRFIH